MNDMKCPICNDGKIITYLDGTYECDNHECSIYNGTHTETFEALIRAHKALDVAKDRLDTVRQYYRGTAVIGPGNIAEYCDRAIERINQIIEKE